MSDLNELLKELNETSNYKNKDGSYNKLRKSNENIRVDTSKSNGKHLKNIKEILSIANKSGASDIHISVGAPPKYRINGELRAIPEYTLISPEESCESLKRILSEEQITQFEQDGDLDFALNVGGVGRFRCNYFKQRGTWAAVFRSLSNKIPTTSDLGLPSSIVNLINKKRGLVLVTGPTGSGKSTTLASLINEINSKYRKNIITLEDPIEYIHKHGTCNVNQREIGSDSKSFASSLRAALREDPDVILVGEMRDYETISTAITAAETGHLVFSTLHTIGAAATVDRIIDTYPEKQQSQARSQLSTVLEGVISQQLIPRKSGNGRVAAFEIMLGNIAIRNLIREGKTAQMSSAIQSGRQDGMTLLDDNLLELVRLGTISQESALEFSVNTKMMIDKFGGSK